MLKKFIITTLLLFTCSSFASTLFQEDFRVTCKGCPRFVRRSEEHMRKLIAMVCKDNKHYAPIVRALRNYNDTYAYEAIYKYGSFMIVLDKDNDSCCIEFVHEQDTCSWTSVMSSLITMVRYGESADVDVSFERIS